KKFAAQSPELVASHGDQDDDDDNGKDGVGVAASFGDPDQSAQAVFGQQNDLRHDDPSPTHAVHSAEMVPDIRLRHGEQDVAHKLPLGCAFRDRDIQVGVRHIRNVFNHQGQ